MCVRNFKKIFLFLALLAVLAGCGVEDTFFSSSGTYKVNAMADNIPIDDLSFIRSNTKIQPFFEDDVYDDPDVNTLMVYLRGANGEIAGWKVIYTLEQDYLQDNFYEEDYPENDTTGNNSVIEPEENPFLDLTDNSLTDNLLTDNSSAEDPVIEDFETASEEAYENIFDIAKEDPAVDLYEPASEYSSEEDTSREDTFGEEDASGMEEITGIFENPDENPIENPNEDSSDITTDNSMENSIEYIKDNIINNDQNAVSLEIFPNTPKTYKDGEELIIKVKNLNELPNFPIPSDLPIGRYTLVFQIMRDFQILHRSEKVIYYLSNMNFSFNGIQVHRGYSSAASQHITRGSIIMLEAQLDYDSRLDPYIVWYSSRKVIGEGRFSEGAGSLLWQTPENSGLFSVYAEVYPVANHSGLSGYVKELSLLTSSRNSAVYLVPENLQDLIYWYTFEGILNDKRKTAVQGNNLTPARNIAPDWIAVNGSYGLGAGRNNTYTLPAVSFKNVIPEKNDDEDTPPVQIEFNNNWKIICRFNMYNPGTVLTVQFGPVNNVYLVLSAEKEEKNGIRNSSVSLSLISPFGSVTRDIDTTDIINDAESGDFLTAEICFSVLYESLIADFNIVRDSEELDFFETAGENKFGNEPLFLEASVNNEYKIILGSGSQLNTQMSSAAFTAIWDELAVISTQLLLNVKPDDSDEETESPAEPAAENISDSEKDELSNQLLTENEELNESDDPVSDDGNGEDQLELVAIFDPEI